jgi:hypothetical protein
LFPEAFVPPAPDVQLERNEDLEGDALDPEACSLREFVNTRIGGSRAITISILQPRLNIEPTI